jgi:hypothetical protein
MGAAVDPIAAQGATAGAGQTPSPTPAPVVAPITETPSGGIVNSALSNPPSATDWAAGTNGQGRSELGELSQVMTGFSAATGRPMGQGATTPGGQSDYDYYDEQIRNGKSVDDILAGIKASPEAQAYAAAHPNGAPASAPAGAPPPGTGIPTGIVNGASNYQPWKLDPSQTVEGRIQSIVNGAIGQQAKSNALDQANARGLLNSDLAISAGEQAAYAAAQPIAQADAATAAKAASYNADIQNQMGMQGAQLTAQQKIAQLSADTQKYTANLDASTRTTLQDLQNKNQLAITTTTQGASIWNQAVAAISQIQGNDKMDATSKQTAIAQIMQNTNNQLRAMSSVTGLNVQLDLSNYPGFDAHGNYVGFGGGTAADTGTPAPGTSNPFTNLQVNTQ